MNSIDTYKEKIISLDEGAKHVSRISGTKRNRRVLIRWSNRGVAGVKLPTIRIGGQIYTSQEALNWFLNASREAKTQQRSKATAEGMRRAKLVDSDVELAAKELGI